jgi:alpha-mannosidase
LSQHLGFRFPREQVMKRAVEPDAEPEEFRTWYSDIRCLSSEVTCAGPALGEIVTTGELLDPTTGVRLTSFRQTFRAWRGRPFLEIEIELFDVSRTPEGDPWSNFYGSRFAWNDSTAALSQSVLGAAQTIQMERIESPDFMEIASSDEERTTILPLGLPFHRKTGPRMLDSLLVVEGETERRFKFVIGIDQHYPMQAAQSQMSPVVPIHTEAGPPPNGNTGWFYHVNVNCVQVTHLSGLLPEPLDPAHGAISAVEALADSDPCEDDGRDLSESASPILPVAAPATPPDRRGFSMRLQETEGRYQTVHVEMFRNPSNARIRDFRGQTVIDVAPSGDGVLVDLSPFGIAEVEVFFD